MDPVYEGQTAVVRQRVSALAGAAEVMAAKVMHHLPVGIFNRRAEDADRVTQMSVFAAHEAIQMSGVEPESIGMLTWGTGYGGATTLDDAYQRLFFGRNDLTGRVSPLTVPKAMSHASAAGVASWFRLSCPVMTYSNACASSAVAIGEAMLAIGHGRCDVAIVGGAEALIVPGVVRAWEALGALATPDQSGVWRGPFDKFRNGLALGEGAACLILESASHAQARGAPVLARCVGYGHTNDPECVTRPQAAPQINAMRAALRHAGITSNQLAYVNAHATGTRTGDAAEIESLNELLLNTDVRVSSTKWATGHLMGAAGALEAILSIQALRTERCPPNADGCQRDARIQFQTPTRSQALPRYGFFLSNSFAFGGTNVSLVFSTHD